MALFNGLGILGVWVPGHELVGVNALFGQQLFNVQAQVLPLPPGQDREVSQDNASCKVASEVSVRAQEYSVRAVAQRFLWSPLPLGTRQEVVQWLGVESWVPTTLLSCPGPTSLPKCHLF
jgi:hypothetical protein